MNKIKVLLFAQLTEIAGQQEIYLSLNPENTASEVIEKLVQQYPKMEAIQESLLVAVDAEQISLDSQIGEVKEEIAIFPPVSGG